MYIRISITWKGRDYLSIIYPVMDDFKPPFCPSGDKIFKLFTVKAGLSNHPERKRGFFFKLLPKNTIIMYHAI